MIQLVEVKIEKQKDSVLVSNNLGKKWKYETNDPAGILCALVANSCYEFFRHFDEVSEDFTMSLTVSRDGK